MFPISLVENETTPELADLAANIRLGGAIISAR